MYPLSNRIPSTSSSSIPKVCDSSTVITPSLPTLSMASAICWPISASPAEMAATWAISSFSSISLAWFLICSTADSTPCSMPRFRAMGLAPAATLRSPSLTMAWARTVAVVVPSPATSSVFLATSLTSSAPIFSSGSSSSISLAIDTPSLVIVGAPHFFSRTTFLPLGPRVIRTAFASWSMPRSRDRRASSSNVMILAAIGSSSGCARPRFHFLSTPGERVLTQSIPPGTGRLARAGTGPSRDDQAPTPGGQGHGQGAVHRETERVTGRVHAAPGVVLGVPGELPPVRGQIGTGPPPHHGVPGQVHPHAQLPPSVVQVHVLAEGHPLRVPAGALKRLLPEGHRPRRGHEGVLPNLLGVLDRDSRGALLEERPRQGPIDAHRHVGPSLQRLHQALQPLRLEHAIGVRHRDGVVGRGPDSGVPPPGDVRTGLLEQRDARSRPQDLQRAVGGAAVDHDDLVGRARLRCHRGNEGAHVRRRVLDRGHQRHLHRGARPRSSKRAAAPPAVPPRIRSRSSAVSRSRQVHRAARLSR